MLFERSTTHLTWLYHWKDLHVGLSLSNPWTHVLDYFTSGYSLNPNINNIITLILWEMGWLIKEKKIMTIFLGIRFKGEVFFHHLGRSLWYDFFLIFFCSLFFGLMDSYLKHWHVYLYKFSRWKNLLQVKIYHQIIIFFNS